METLLSPKQVAVAIGVSDASLKRWCDKGLIPTMRTPGGHRKLPLAGVIQFIRTTGHPIERPEVLGLPAATRKTAPTIDHTTHSIAEALQNGDAEQFRRLLFGTYLAGRSVQEICDQIIAPAFRLLGEAWAHGALEVFQERRGVEICLSFLHELKATLPPPPPAALRAAGGTLAHDHYGLPTTMAELALRELGWHAQSYGCGLPPDTVCAALESRPAIFWLSVSHLSEADPPLAAFRQIGACAARLGVTLAVGGRAWPPELREPGQPWVYCARLRDLVELAARRAATLAAG